MINMLSSRACYSEDYQACTSTEVSYEDETGRVYEVRFSGPNHRHRAKAYMTMIDSIRHVSAIEEKLV